MSGQNENPSYMQLCLLGSLLLVASLAAGCYQAPEQVRSHPAPPSGFLHLGWIWPREETETLLWPDIAVGPDGVFYVTDGEGTLHAIAAPGDELWRYRGDYEFASPPVLAPNGDLLYFVTDNDMLYAVDTGGQKRWAFEAAHAIRRMPIVSPDGTVYLQTETRTYRVFPDGSSEYFPWPQWASPAHAAIDDQGRLYLPLLVGGSIQILGAEGQLLKSCDAEGFVRSRPVIGGKDSFLYTPYTPEDGISIIARDVECNLLWRFATGEHCGEIDCPFVTSEDGTVYLGGQHGRIHALSADDGHVLWQRDIDTSQGDIVHLTLGDDALFATNSNFELLAFNRESGVQIWSHLMYEASLPGRPQVTTEGDVGVVQAGRLKVFTADTSLVYQQPTPVPTPVNTTQAEEEIVSFVVDFIVECEIGGTADYIRSSGQPWVDAPPEANIIIWAPVARYPRPDQEYFEPQLDHSHPIRVWWYADGQLTETEDRLKSIEEYQQLYMEEASSNIWAWGYYDFGIISVAEGRQEAEVYLGASCGPLCGHGYLYTLRRSPSGQWGIVRSEHLWQS